MKEHLLEQRKGDPISWAVAPLHEQLIYYCKHVDIFRDVLSKLFMENGNRWHMVFYVDEATPGALLRADNKRKTALFYCSFMEFAQLLSFDAFWFPLAAIRSNLLKTSWGGLSEATDILHRDLYLGDSSLATIGVNLPIGLNGTSELVFVEPWAVLGDEDALSGIWGIKGSAGTVPCGLKCAVIAKQRGCAHAALFRGDTFKSISCSDIDQIPQLTDNDVWWKVDELERNRNLNKTEFKRFEQGLGMNHVKRGFLQDRELRHMLKPTKMNRFDVMHIIYSGGILPTELGLLLTSIKTHTGLFYRDLHDFFGCLSLASTWQHCKPQDCFNPTREKAFNGTCKGGASEFMTVYPGVRHWIETTPAIVNCRAIQKEVDSFLKLCKVCDIVKEATRSFGDEARKLALELKVAIKEYFDAAVRTYGKEMIRPKFHMLLHVPPQILLDGMLLWCMTVERKHQLFLQVSSQIDNTTTFEASVMPRLVALQAESMRRFKGSTYLDGAVRLDPVLADKISMPHARLSDRMTFNHTAIAKGDIVFQGNNACIIHECIDFGKTYAIKVQMMEGCRKLTDHSDEWTIPKECMYVRLEPEVRLRQASFWKINGPAAVVIR